MFTYQTPAATTTQTDPPGRVTQHQKSQIRLMHLATMKHHGATWKKEMMMEKVTKKLI